MEIKLEKIVYQNKNEKIFNKVNATINEGIIYGLIGNNKSVFLDIIDLTKRLTKGEILINDKLVTSENISNFRKEIALIKQNSSKQFFTNNVREEFEFVISNLNYDHKNITKKITNALLIVGLNEKYLENKIDELSSSEKKLVQLAIMLVYNPKVIMLDELFVDLDLNNKKRFIKLIKMLKEKYNKTVIISTNNTDILYELTNKLIVLKNDEIIIDKTELLLENKEFMEKNNLEIPRLIEFVHKAKSKKIKLFYHKDIRDLIKDVYKHV